MYKFVLAFVVLLSLSTVATARINPDAQWYFAGNQWNKQVADDTTYFLRHDHELGFVYGVAVNCPAGSLEQQDVTIIFFIWSTNAQKVVEVSSRSLCDNSEGTPALTYTIWLEAVGEMPPL